MQKYVKAYLDYNGFDSGDFIPCQVCGAPAQDIHHIKGRIGLLKNNPQFLIALCRPCHNKAHANILTKEFLLEIIKP